jgi:hypothetical protein
MSNRVKTTLRRLFGQPSRDDRRRPDDPGAGAPEPPERRPTQMPVVATLEPAREVARIGVRLLDDAYMTWFSASIGAEQALRAWFDATPGEGSPAYFAYCAALDREEAAARDLERLWEVSRPDREALGRAR